METIKNLVQIIGSASGEIAFKEEKRQGLQNPSTSKRELLNKYKFVCKNFVFYVNL